MPNELLKFMLEYSSRGWSGFPCACKGKVPATTHGFKDATTDARQIERWRAKNPNYNIGIATGSVSGFFVLDVDGSSGKETLEALEEQYGKLPQTVTVETRNGWHLYFQMPAGIDIRNKQSFRPGLDIRGNGGYVVAPPSIHPSGIRIVPMFPELKLLFRDAFEAATVGANY